MDNTGLIYIQGRLYPKTMEGIVSSAEHIFDPNVDKFQTSVNKEVYNTIYETSISDFIESTSSGTLAADEVNKLEISSDFNPTCSDKLEILCDIQPYAQVTVGQQFVIKLTAGEDEYCAIYTFTGEEISEEWITVTGMFNVTTDTQNASDYSMELINNTDATIEYKNPNIQLIKPAMRTLLDDHEQRIETLETVDVQNKIDALDTKLNVFMKGGKVTISTNPSVVHSYNDPTTVNVKLTGTLSNLNPTDPLTTLSILDQSNNELLSVSGVNTIEHEYAYDVKDRGTTTFKIKATFEGIEGYSLTNSVAFYVEHPIYSGCSSKDVDSVITENISEDWKHNPTSTLPTKYVNTVDKEENQYFYILIPQKMGSYSSFTMGGSPFAMDSYVKTIALTDTVNVNYNVYKSANMQGMGSSINVTAIK